MKIGFNFHYRMCNFFHLLFEILIDLSLRSLRSNLFPDGALPYVWRGDCHAPFGARNDRFLIVIPMKIGFNFHYRMCKFFHLLFEILIDLSLRSLRSNLFPDGALPYVLRGNCHALFGARNDRFLIAIPMKIEFNFHISNCW